MRTNIPIFRAKKIDSDEYVMGWYSSPIIIEGKTYLSITNKDGEYRIDTTTLSIHFSDMLDSQGNEIFASLQEDGKGGDIITDGEYDFVVIFNGNKFDLMFVEDNTFTKFNEWDDWNLFNKKGVKK